MKKLVAFAAAAALAFGSAVPAFAAPGHHGAAHCFGGESELHTVVCDHVMPNVASLHECMMLLIEQANAASAVQAAPAAQAPQAASAQSTPQAESAPAASGYGPCGYYADADGDGICDYHGSGCYGSGYGYGSAGSNSGYGYGYHHGGGHHGGGHHRW